MTPAQPRPIPALRRLAPHAAFLAAALALAAPAPAQEPAAPLKIVFFTDVHARAEWNTPEALRMAAEAINAQQADVVICGGDMITEGYESSAETVAHRWEVYRAFHDAIRPAPMSVVGNHDLVGVEPADGSPPAGDPRAEVRARMDMPQTYRSFDHGGVHFILLDSMEVTQDDLKYRGFIGPEQMAWLRANLAQVSADTPIVVATHLPLLTGFYQATGGIQTPVPANRGVVNNREVLAAFDQHRLVAVLQGHLHVNELLRWKNTTFITGGAICGQWWRGPRLGTPEGFGVLTLHPDRVEWEYLTYGWEARRPTGQ
jgi:3',5'-cyclic-AMP phosphodiesterase